jgi:sterol desaturase/sphingolipid hydroxylase (fatty acid hydroxylase superfamily)
VTAATRVSVLRSEQSARTFPLSLMRAVKVSQDAPINRMFESDFFEFFSHIPPWQPPAIFLPVIGWSAWNAFAVGTAILPFFGLLAVGVITWSLMEYWLHRLVFHYEAKSKLGKRFFWLAHGVHHDWPNDKLRLVFPPSISIPIAIGVWYLFSWIFGDVYRWAPYTGIAIGYLAYDMIHYYVHHFAPKNRIGKFLRRYHLAHHFKESDNGFGVSSPVWDYVFGTRPRWID